MKKKTDRGFRIYTEFKDRYQQTISVQESSIATEHCCWIFTKYPEGGDSKVHMGNTVVATPHLTKKQARMLANALLRFADSV